MPNYRDQPNAFSWWFLEEDSNPQPSDSKFSSKLSTPMYSVHIVHCFQYMGVHLSVMPIVSMVSRLFAAKLQQEISMEM